MAHINLLPWREERRKEKEKNFYIALGASFLFGAIVFYLVFVYVDKLIDEQNQRNKFLEQQIKIVEMQIKEIKDLEKQRDSLLARMQVIQELQASRPKIVKVLDSLAKVMPEGVNMDSLSRKGTRIEINGEAQSNARVSVLMKEIDKNPEYKESTLNVVQKKSAADNVPRTFKLQVQEAKTKNSDEGAQ
jgi:type IV pilus assembly protein PilN